MGDFLSYKDIEKEQIFFIIIIFSKEERKASHSNTRRLIDDVHLNIYV